MSADDAAAWRWTGGTFWSPSGGTVYDPVPTAATIFNDALRVDPDELESLLAFVRAWGVPWTSRTHSSDTVSGSVWGVRRLFRELQRHFAWAQVLHRHEWRAPAIPSLWGHDDELLDAVRVLMTPAEQEGLAERWPSLVQAVCFDPGRRSTRYQQDAYVAACIRGHFFVGAWVRKARVLERQEMHWHAFGFALAEHLRWVHPTVGWTDGRPVAMWDVPYLGDLLWVQLWNVVTGGAAIRRCRHCRRWFPVDRRGKVYCSRVCTNRASAAASYEARKTRHSTRRTKR